MKKSFIKISPALALTFMMLLGACEQRFDEFNSNPNAPANASPEFVLPGAIVDLAYYTNYQLGINYIGLWVQQHASGAYPEEDQYSPRLDDINIFWNNIYDNNLKDLRYIIDNGSPNQVAVAKILSAYGFMALTDIWGDIPYSQALQAEKGDEYLTPAFDTQQAVYEGIIKDLDDAVKMMDKSSIDRFGEQDLMLHGDLDLWEKFANSLRLRAYLHLSEVDPTTSRAGIEAMLVKPLISSNSENIALHFVDVPGNRNPIHSHFSGRPNDFRMSKSMMDRLIGSGDSLNPADPRTEMYAERNIEGYFVGVPNGVNGLGDVGLDNFTSCKFGPSFLEAAAPLYFMTYAEVEFIRAEAAARGWIAADAKTAYETAIKASFDQHGITDAAVIDAFLADPNVAYDPARGLELVSTQKWIAMFGQPIESWTNFRRTDWPQLPIALNDQNNGEFPKRMFYPAVEQTTNGANVTAATERQGGAELADPIWWDVD
ncbi:MAG: SusD/RagB family nutrient-binding outer membrane lipoprotein [Bacteroidia bacterium]|nr:SusD/RagB family nutrient-binding outer membrane lipoprotein [Bacteroidia bacterium]